MEHTHLFKEKIENSLLSLMLGDGAFQPDLKITQVQLQPGPMVVDPRGVDAWAFFPVDALITIGVESSSQAAVTLVGRHGCVLWSQAGEGAMNAHVMAPGRAYRVDWTAVRNDPTRYAKWLWHAAAATQGLIQQMAQWSFCVQHHTPVQRLASWLLHCWAQSPQFQLPRHAMPPAMRQCLEALPSEAFHAQLQPDFEVCEGFLPAVVPQHLQALACTCHQKIAVRREGFQ